MHADVQRKNKTSRRLKGETYELATYNIRIRWDRASLCECFIRTAGEDGLRPRRKFQPVQNVLLGKGPNTRPALGRPDQRSSQRRPDGKGHDTSAIWR